MNYYKTFDSLPLINWFRLQESFKTEPDFRYLIKNVDIDNLPKKVNQNELQETYFNLMFQISEIDITLSRLSILYRANFIKYNIQTELKRQVSDSDLNTSFRMYLNYLDEHFKNFQITEFYLADFTEKLLFELNLDKEKVNEIINIKFYHFHEFIEFCQKQSHNIALVLLHISDKIIQKRTITINKLSVLNEHLTNFYKLVNQYEKVHKTRYELFYKELRNIKRENEHEKNITIVDEIIRLNEFLSINLTLQSSTAEYFSAKDRAKEKTKEIEKHGKV